MTDWNYADVWETVAEELPDGAGRRPGGAVESWAELDRRADGVARWLLDLGAARQDKVALYLYNCPEYLEAALGTMKVGLVPVNTNYRYLDDELVHLWDNADAVAVVFHGTFTERVEGLRRRVPEGPSLAVRRRRHRAVPGVGRPLRGGRHLGRGRGPAPVGPQRRRPATSSTPGAPPALPKGVMWRQDDLFCPPQRRRLPPLRPSTAGSTASAGAWPRPGPGLSLLAACPLMHGTGGFMAIECLSEGGKRGAARTVGTSIRWSSSTPSSASRVQGMAIVGDPFARPMLAALEANPGRWDLSSLGRDRLLGGDVERAGEGRPPGRAPRPCS